MIKELPFKQGDKYGYFTLTGKFDFRFESRVRYVECVCECGKISYKSLNALKRGEIKSCGCKSKELNRVASTRHGFSSRSGDHPIYNCWNDMKSRCYNSNTNQYKDYGGRGIIVCDEWKNDFNSFCKWAIENGWRKGLTLERKRNNGIYEPNNCKWADRPTQLRNTRRNINLTIFGETKCMTDWVSDNRCLVKQPTLRSRIIVLKWDAEKAITTPPVPHSERRNYKLSQCGH